MLIDGEIQDVQTSSEELVDRMFAADGWELPMELRTFLATFLEETRNEGGDVMHDFQSSLKTWKLVRSFLLILRFCCKLLDSIAKLTFISLISDLHKSSLRSGTEFGRAKVWQAARQIRQPRPSKDQGGSFLSFDKHSVRSCQLTPGEPISFQKQNVGKASTSSSNPSEML